MISLEFIYLLIVLDNISDMFIVVTAFTFFGVFLPCIINDIKIEKYIVNYVVTHKICCGIITILLVSYMLLVPSKKELVYMYTNYLSQHNIIQAEDIHNTTYDILKEIKRMTQGI